MKCDSALGKRKINAIELSGNRLQLLPVGEYGFEDFYEYSIKPKFYDFIEYDGFSTRGEVLEYLNGMIEKSKSDNSQFWFIRLKDNGKIVGTFCVVDFDSSRDSVEIGYGLSPDFWGNGYFSEALLVVLDYLFCQLSVHRVYAKTMEENTPSISALTNQGFVIEGIGRDFYKYASGARVNACFLSLLSAEYLCEDK